MSMMTHYCQSRPSYKFVSLSNFIIFLLSLIDSRSFLKIFCKVPYGIIKKTMGNLLLNSLYAIVSSLGISYNVFCSHFSLSTSSQPLSLTTHPTWCLLFVFFYILSNLCQSNSLVCVVFHWSLFNLPGGILLVNWLPFSQQLSNANHYLTRGKILCLTHFSMSGFVRFVHVVFAVITTVT